jgi:hypothetical protein
MPSYIKDPVSAEWTSRYSDVVDCRALTLGFNTPDTTAGTTANMSNPPGIGGKGSFAITMIWGQNALTAITTVLRLYTRHFVGTQIGSDDYSLIVTWVSTERPNLDQL